MVHQRNRRIYSVQGFFSYFDALCSEWCWITLFSKENAKSVFGFLNPILDFLEKTHPSVLPVHLNSVKILRGSVRDKRQHVYASWGAWLGEVGRHTRLQLSSQILLLLLSIFWYKLPRLSCLVSWILLKVIKNTKWRHTYLNSMCCLSSRRDTLSQFFLQ